MKIKIKSAHPLQWIVEPLEQNLTFVQRKMFGAEIVSIDSKQVLALTASKEPWDGLLVCTSHEHHDSLMNEYPALKPHSILGKWLYIPQSHHDFEMVAEEIRGLILAQDPRIGVESKPRTRKTLVKR